MWQRQCLITLATPLEDCLRILTHATYTGNCLLAKVQSAVKIKTILYQSSIISEKVVFTLKKAYLLFIGIDISSMENVVAVMDFESAEPIASFAVQNNEPDAEEMP